jgi:hypothetical protein
VHIDTTRPDHRHVEGCSREGKKEQFPRRARSFVASHTESTAPMNLVGRVRKMIYDERGRAGSWSDESNILWIVYVSIRDRILRRWTGLSL